MIQIIDNQIGFLNAFKKLCQNAEGIRQEYGVQPRDTSLKEELVIQLSYFLFNERGSIGKVKENGVLEGASLCWYVNHYFLPVEEVGNNKSGNYFDDLKQWLRDCGSLQSKFGDKKLSLKEFISS